MRTGTSPNPSDQMKRGTPQMNNSGIPSPIPEGGQSRGSPNSMNFMPGGPVDPNMGPPFNMNAQGQMNGMRPPSSHPGQPFNGQMTPQMMAARQQQQQGGQGPGQWQPGPNGQMPPQGMQPNQGTQGTPQQRSMPPPSAPVAAAAAANNRTTASPQQAAAAPPTPKTAPKKKETKAAKDKVRSSGIMRPRYRLLTICNSALPKRKEHRTPPPRRLLQITQRLLPVTVVEAMVQTMTAKHRLRQRQSPQSTQAISPRTDRMVAPDRPIRQVVLAKRRLRQGLHKVKATPMLMA